MSKLLTIDLSTTCTGWALFDVEKKQLLDFGVIKPVRKGLSKFNYPLKQLLIMRSLADQLEILIRKISPDRILIEEVNRHKSRMTGKTLDGAHWILLNKLLISEEDYAKMVRYRDSDGGPEGWRNQLKMRLTENDKKSNAFNQKINRKKVRGTADLPIITKKHLAARIVNSTFGTAFDVDKNSEDSDICDAIAMGISELSRM